MKDSRNEQKMAKKAATERRVKFAADQFARERQAHLETAKRELADYRRGIRSFAFAAVIKNELTLANASPGDIGMSHEELDELELQLIEEAGKEIEFLRLNPTPERIVILRRDMKRAGYSPELLGTTRGELEELETKAQNNEARHGIPGHSPPFENRFR